MPLGSRLISRGAARAIGRGVKRPTSSAAEVGVFIHARREGNAELEPGVEWDGVRLTHVRSGRWGEARRGEALDVIAWDRIPQDITVQDGIGRDEPPCEADSDRQLKCSLLC